jgi:DNA-binding HxlR family transcriptional regulator
VQGDRKPQRAGGEPALGRPALALLGQRWAIAVLLELEGGRLRPHELERRVPALSHAALMRRLTELGRGGAVHRERSGDIPPRAYYALTGHGRRLIAIARQAVSWERRAHDGARGVPGARALRAIADERSLALMRELAGAPLGPREHARRVAAVDPIAHASLMRRVSRMEHEGLLHRVEPGGGVLYALAREARLLGALAILAMRCERRRLLADEPAPSSDLVGMLRLLAPVVDVPQDVCGTYLLYVSAGAERERSLYLRAGGGRLATIAQMPPEGISGFLVAPLETWLRTLADGPARGLTAAGDLRGVDATLRALSAPLEGGAHGRPLLKIS